MVSGPSKARCPTVGLVVWRWPRLRKRMAASLLSYTENEKQGEPATTADPGQRHAGCWRTRRAAVQGGRSLSVSHEEEISERRSSRLRGTRSDGGEPT